MSAFVKKTRNFSNTPKLTTINDKGDNLEVMSIYG